MSKSISLTRSPKIVLCSETLTQQASPAARRPVQTLSQDRDQDQDEDQDRVQDMG